MPPPARSGVLLTVAYDGSQFAGFAPQRQQRTVAGELLAAIQRLDPQVSKLRVASRTDAGVHARGQRVAFDTDRDIPPRGWVLGLVRHLPKAIAIRAAVRVAAGYNPRFEALKKHYRYLLCAEALNDPFWANRAWRVDGMASYSAIQTMAAELLPARGTHHFDAFRSARDERPSAVRNIFGTAVRRLERTSAIVAIDIQGDGFYHHMVRILVGTIVDVARGRLPAGALTRALQSGKRRDAGITAPADGLYLERLWLVDEDGDDRWPPARTQAV